MENKTDIPIQPATIHDIPILVEHHHKMFEEIWSERGLEINTPQFEDMDKAHTNKLSEEFLNGTCKAWVIRHGDEIVASGALTITSMTPIPEDPSHKVAYLHSVYTEQDYRNRGFGELITINAIQYCKSKGIKRITLGASDAGRPIYEKVGFLTNLNSMILFIE